MITISESPAIQQQVRVPGAPHPWRSVPATVYVVLPAYNEEESLGPLLERIDTSMHEDEIFYKVIVIDDGSRDRTLDVARRYALDIPIHIVRHEKNQGLGATIRDGLRTAALLCSPHDVIVAMDADNTHTPGLIRSMVRLIREGSDVVIASRYQPGSFIRGVPFHRNLISFGARLLFKIVFPIRGVRDYTCGYRAYRGSVLREAFDRYGESFINEEGFQCMVDILLKLRHMDLIFREVPLILRYDLKGGASKMKILRTIVRTLNLMLRRRLGR